MLSKEDSLRWLKGRTDECRSSRNDTGELVDDLDDIGKLGQGFSVIDELSEVDISTGRKRRPTYESVNLTVDQRE
jgi:hypothetical protein